MRSSPLSVTALALLVVLAGCAGVTSQNPGATTDATTGETTANPAEPDLPPGLSESGVEDPGALADAHQNRLTGQSLTLESVRVERYANGSLKARTERTIRAEANRSVYSVRTNASGPDPAFLGGSEGRLELWANGTHVFRALTVNGSTSYGIVHNPESEPADPRERLVGDLSLAGELLVVFTAFDGERVEREPNATAPVRYRITAGELAHADMLGPSGAEARNATLSAVVEYGGPGFEGETQVRNYTVAYTTTIDGETVRVTERVRFSNVGRTSVERPPWYGEVANRTKSE